MLSANIKKALLRPINIVLVIGYIIFEEIIWNNVAKPIYQYLKKLAILDALRQTFLEMNRYLLVSVFISILILAEYLGILSVITIAQEQLVLGVFIYALKIPIATFTFWLFELTKPQLMTFGWLKIAYEALVKGINLLVNSKAYQAIKATVQRAKQAVRELKTRLKNSALFQYLLASYRAVKAFFFKKTIN